MVSMTIGESPGPPGDTVRETCFSGSELVQAMRSEVRYELLPILWLPKCKMKLVWISGSF